MCRTTLLHYDKAVGSPGRLLIGASRPPADRPVEGPHLRHAYRRKHRCLVTVLEPARAVGRTRILAYRSDLIAAVELGNALKAGAVTRVQYEVPNSR
ncbi:MAG: hypothetical protein ACC645_22940 [Pirellulales bacterium]